MRRLTPMKHQGHMRSETTSTTTVFAIARGCFLAVVRLWITARRVGKVWRGDSVATEWESVR